MSRNRNRKSSSKPEEKKTNVTSSSDSSTSSKDGELDKTQEKGKNDVAWYARDPRLVMDAAKIPFNKPFGTLNDPFDGQGSNITPKTRFSEYSALTSTPGICTLMIKPSFGQNTRKTDPLNVCANALYTHVRYVNSGRKNYDPADLMIYTAAFADIYSFVMWVERIYKLAFMYSQRNYYIGREMLISEGVDPDSIISNLANFRYWINTVINKVSSFCLPGDIFLFQRRVFLYSNYYIENPYGNVKDQLYMMTPEGFHRFVIDSNNNAGKLEYFKLVRTSLMSFNYLQSIFNHMMDNITGDEDFGLMSGDILKAYGSNIIGISQLDPEAELIPIFDPYVLSQFKNAHILDVYRDNTAVSLTLPDGGSYKSGDVSQSTDGLLISLEVSDLDGKFALLAAMNKPISSESADPDVGDVIEATRLMVSNAGTYRENSAPKYWLWHSGTEIVVSAIFTDFHKAYNGNPAYAHIKFGSNILDASTKDRLTAKVDLLDTAFGKFKYAPVMFFAHNTPSSDWDYSYDLFEIASNLDNMTMLSNENVTRIHEVALLSLFYVPGVAKLLS